MEFLSKRGGAGCAEIILIADPSGVAPCGGPVWSLWWARWSIGFPPLWWAHGGPVAAGNGKAYSPQLICREIGDRE